MQSSSSQFYTFVTSTGYKSQSRFLRVSGLTFWELEASRNAVPSASAFAAASENEIGPNALAENPTLKPRRFNADEPICLFPRFDTLGGPPCPPRPGTCASIEPIESPTPTAKAATAIL